MDIIEQIEEISIEDISNQIKEYERKLLFWRKLFSARIKESSNESNTSHEDVKMFVNSYYGIDISVKSRLTEYVWARYAYYYLCREFLPEISRRTVLKSVGSSQSNVIINGLKKTDLWLHSDETFTEYVFPCIQSFIDKFESDEK